jgi:tetratricopeptide (TPR) repeat protein
MVFLFFPSTLHADTVSLKNGKQLKGLIVEEHEDRILLSTASGEIQVLRRGIKKITFDDPAQNFLKAGRDYEEKERWGEALGYYEKALELNPDLDDAKKAAVRVRNLFWAKSAVGPVDEIEKRQELYEMSNRQRFRRDGSRQSGDPAHLLRDGMGVQLGKKGDWVQLTKVTPGKDAVRAGLRLHDRLVAVDGTSLRYLSPEAVREKLVSPRYSSFTLEYDRECSLAKTGFEKELGEFGLAVKLEARGLVIQRVLPDSAASRAGLKAEDLLIEVNGGSTRYLPLKKLLGVILKNPPDAHAVLTVRRSALLTRH